MKKSLRNEARSEAGTPQTRPGLVMGYKAFYYFFESPKALHSGFRGGFQWWPERTAEEALCEDGGFWREHEVASNIHSCGFHMLFDLWRAVGLRQTWQPFTEGDYRCVVCLVAAWGNVCHYYSGTRSSHMEIVAVYDPGHERYRTGELADLTGLPHLGAEEIRAYAEAYPDKLIENLRG